jgi:prolipoprotein diacylglyceryltransferase
MHPILFHIGPYPVFSYGVFIILGLPSLGNYFAPALAAASAVWRVGCTMKRKVYATDQERKSDQLHGCIIFPLVNLILAFCFRPAMGVGFIASTALTMIAVVVLGCLLVTSCVTGFAVAIPLGGAEDSTEGTPVAHLLGCLVFFVLFLGGLYWLYRWAHAAYRTGGRHRSEMAR